MRKELHKMRTRVKRIFSMFLPFSLIIFAYILFTKTNTMSDAQLDIIRLSPYAIFSIGIVIAWRFNRSREFFVLIILTLCLSVIGYTKSDSISSTEAADMYSIICLMIPINIALFSFLKERGIISLWGAIRIGIIVGQLLFALWLIYSGERYILDLINKDILSINIDAINSIPQISVIVFLITLVILITREVSYKSSQDVSFIAVLVALFYVLENNSSQILCSVFFAVSGLILIVAIIQDSYYMAFSDELTGLPSRRALKQDMMKLGVNYSIAMLDIDYFKKFNDKYGHDTGDEVLKLVASIIKNVTGGGKSYRYGGEEFTILFPGKSISEVLPHLEELREKISQRGFTIRGKDRPKNKPKKKTKTLKSSKQIFITVSIGVAQKNENYRTPDDVLKSADKALYRAKKKGRNCVSK